MAGPKEIRTAISGSGNKSALNPLTPEQDQKIREWRGKIKGISFDWEQDRAEKLLITIQLNWRLGKSADSEIAELAKLTSTEVGREDTFILVESGGETEAFKKRDYSYRSANKMGLKIGRLNSAEVDYVEWLSGGLIKYWFENSARVNGLEKEIIVDLMEAGATALVRANKGTMEQLIEWGFMTMSMARAINSLSHDLEIDKFGRMFKWFITEHLVYGGISTDELKRSVRKLIPYGYIVYLSEKYGVTEADAWRFACGYNDTEIALAAALKKAEELADMYRSEGVTKADAWWFAKIYVDAEAKLESELRIASDLARRYKAKGVTKADAWFFAKGYIDAEKALKSALKIASDLARRYKTKGVTKADAWFFARKYSDAEDELVAALKKAEELADKYRSEGVTRADAWRFVWAHRDAEGALKQALKKVASDASLSLLKRIRDRVLRGIVIFYLAFTGQVVSETMPQRATEVSAAEYLSDTLSETLRRGRISPRAVADFLKINSATLSAGMPKISLPVEYIKQYRRQIEVGKERMRMLKMRGL